MFAGGATDAGRVRTFGGGAALGVERAIGPNAIGGAEGVQLPRYIATVSSCTGIRGGGGTSTGGDDDAIGSAAAASCGGRLLGGGRSLVVCVALVIRGAIGSISVGTGSRIDGTCDGPRFEAPVRAVEPGEGKRGAPPACGGRAGAFGITIVRSEEPRWLFGTRSMSGRVARVSVAGRPAAGAGARCACEPERVCDAVLGFAFGRDRSLSKTGRSITLVASSSGLDSNGASFGGAGAAGAFGAVGTRGVTGRMTGGFAPPIGRSCGRFGCGGGPGAGRAGGGGRPEPELPPPFFVVIEP